VNLIANANVRLPPIFAQEERFLTTTANAYARALDHLNSTGAMRSKFALQSARAVKNLTTTATAYAPKAKAGVRAKIGVKQSAQAKNHSMMAATASVRQTNRFGVPPTSTA
jgi:poly-gamma-glutamate capsule biosynthesis protein CapA/YwtB (metallophosphatase superfamily)